MKAAGFALAGAAMTFFGFMHGEGIGIGQTPTVAVSYVIISVVFVGCAKFATVPKMSLEEPEETAGESVPA